MLRPIIVTRADELPLDHIPGEAHWSENYCFMGYDYATDVGLYIHIGRWAQDRTIWREQVYVYLPDGTTLHHRSLGKGELSEGPQGALLRLRCAEPGASWNISYHGPTMKMTQEALLAGPVREALLEKMELDAEFHADGPVLMFEISDNANIGRWHYEQEMFFRGGVRFRGQTYEMNGRGWRDHTRGPRYLDTLRGHVNLQARLPDGAKLSAFQVWEERGGEEVMIVSEGRLVRDGKFIPASIVECTRATSPDQYRDEIKLTVEADGDPIALVGRPVNGFTLSCNETFEFVYGVAPELAPLTTISQAIHFDWKGKTVHGHGERSMWLRPKT